MKFSRYMKIYPCKDKPGYSILYSTLQSSVVQIPDHLLQAAHEERIAPEDQATLSRLGLLVPNLNDERNRIAHLFDQANQNYSSFNATIVLNLDCNLGCPYCYEGHFRGHKYMSAATADLLVEHLIKSHIALGRTVNIIFYGGEPLLSLDLILSISSRLYQAASERGAEYSFSLVTNGTLLTRDVVTMLTPLGLTGAKVTLDGPARLHNHSRPFSSGRGSFDLIVHNLLSVCDLISLQLGGNYTQDNYREFPELLDYLIEQGLTPDRLSSVLFAPVLPKAGDQIPRNLHMGCTCSYDPWLVEAVLFLRQETLRRGYTTPKPRCAACIVELENSMIVDHDGSLYKCPAFMAYDFLRIGNLASGIVPYGESHNLDVWKNEECLECAYLPLCFGGCRQLTLLRNGTIEEVDCRKAYYDAVLEEIIRQDLQYQVGKK